MRLDDRGVVLGMDDIWRASGRSKKIPVVRREIFVLEAHRV
jgi:hypothetical protein